MPAALTDAQVERYSRQILLPEVGGRGQERLLAARVALAGADQVAALVATLLGRAGVGTLHLLGGPARLPTLAPECRLERHPDAATAPAADVIVDLTGDPALTAVLARRARAARGVLVRGTRRGTRVAVETLVGRPCGVCQAPPALGGSPAGRGDAALAAPAALALGGLAAAEVLRVLWLAPTTGRIQTLDLATGTGGAAALGPGPGCPLCAESA